MATRETQRKIAPPPGERVAHGPEHEISRTQRGPFEVFHFAGRVNAAAFADVRNKFLKSARFIAIDAGAMDEDPGFPLARELALTARHIAGQGGHVVVLHARGRFRDLVRSVAPDNSLALVPSAAILDGPAETFAQRLTDTLALLARVRQELEHNGIWHMIDSEGRWLCPYCGGLQDAIRLQPRRLIPEAQVEAVYLHLAEACEAHRSGKMPRALQELSEALSGIDQERRSETKVRTTALASRIMALQDRARFAEELEHSIQIATQRQRRLLPAKPPAIEGAVIGIAYFPAQKISGDFYDFIDLGEGRLGLLIGDVAGHGIEAGVLMGVAKKVIQLRARDTNDPVRALQMANRDLYPDLDKATFVSAFLAILDARNRRLISARAGHTPGILFNPARDPNILQIEPAGLVVGLDGGPRFDEALAPHTMELQAGDTLFLYTDGLSEAANQEGEEFGVERICELMRAHEKETPDEFLQTLAQEVERFGKGLAQEDDITAICVKLS